MFPVENQNLHFVEGIRGQAVYIPAGVSGPRGLLGYDAGKAFRGRGGTVMFWFRPDWKGESYGDNRMPPYNLFVAEETGADPSERLRIFLWNQLRADVFRGKAETPVSLHQGNPYAFSMGQDDWFHVALVWNNDGYLKFYLNGLPYNHADGARSWNLYPVPALANFYGVDKFFVGSRPGSGSANLGADAAFDELKVYREALDEAAIAEAYRADCPLALRMDQRYFVANKPVTLTLDAYPAGMAEKPSPAPSGQPIEAAIDCRLYRYPTDETVMQWQWSSRITQPEAFTLELPPLEEGVFFLQCRTTAHGATHQRSFIVSAYTPQPPAPVSDVDIQVGRPLLTLDATTMGNAFEDVHPSRVVPTGKLPAYRETAEENHSSVFFEFDVPKAYRDGGPLVIDFYWPDDKPRAFGLYLYPENRGRPHHRDRLMGGIQSGLEYPVSGELQRTRYLFFPWAGRYLFEMRSLIADMPGALSRMEVSPLAGRLPRLALNPPEGFPARSFGVFDEDQTFEIVFNFDQDRFEPLYLPRLLDQIVDYLDYVGQDVLSYQLVRYDYVRYDIPGAIQSIHNLRSAPGFFPLMLDMFAARNKAILAGIDLYALPETSLQPEQNGRRKRVGYFQTDAKGEVIAPRVGYGRANLLHHEARASFMGHVDEILSRYGRHPGFAGFNLWARDVFWDAEGGFSDFTIQQFEADTGIAVPGGDGKDRFAKRRDFLLGEQREVWLDWRCEKTAEIIAEFSARMLAVNPDLHLYLSFSGIEQIFPQGWERTLNEGQYEETLRLLGFDLLMLRSIPALVLMPVSNPSMNRWQMHRTGIPTNLDALFGSRANYAFFRKVGVPLAAASFFRFFESYQKPIRAERFGSYFQSADAKPHGRYFLKAIAEAVVNLDPRDVLIGGQPFATLGREAESREFAQAFNALPALPFNDFPGQGDPVLARWVTSGDDTWVYLINRTWAPLTVHWPATVKPQLTDLSTGGTLHSKANAYSVTLKPYELRSFHTDGNFQPAELTVDGSLQLAAYYRGQLAELESVMQAAAAQGGDMEVERAILSGLREAVEEGRYAEAHRLLFCLPVRQLEASRAALEKGYMGRRQSLLGQGRVAIDLGSGEFYEASDGTLFFPDQPYHEGGYGFVGPDKTVVRLTGNMQATNDPVLFETERWMMQGYRIDLPPGSYHLRTYQKIGYEPNRASGKVVFGIRAEDGELAPIEDIFETLGRDGNKVLIRDYPPIQVEDGTLDLEFVRAPTTDPSVPFLNAIEIIPEPSQS